jgi:hypothetical protein
VIACPNLTCRTRPTDPFWRIHHFNVCNLARFDELLAALDGALGLRCPSGHVHECARRSISLCPPLYEIHDLYPKCCRTRALEHGSKISIRGIPEFIGIDWQDPVGAPSIRLTRQLSENLRLSVCPGVFGPLDPPVRPQLLQQPVCAV